MKVASLDIVYGCRKPAVPEPTPSCPASAAKCQAPADCPPDHACVGGCCSALIK